MLVVLWVWWIDKVVITGQAFKVSSLEIKDCLNVACCMTNVSNWWIELIYRVLYSCFSTKICMCVWYMYIYIRILYAYKRIEEYIYFFLLFLKFSLCLLNFFFFADDVNKTVKRTVIISQDCFGYMGSFVVPYTF